jgi:uncharacterized membrane protein
MSMGDGGFALEGVMIFLFMLFLLGVAFVIWLLYKDFKRGRNIG